MPDNENVVAAERISKMGYTGDVLRGILGFKSGLRGLDIADGGDEFQGGFAEGE